MIVPPRWPRNLSVVGIMADPEHAQDIGEVIRQTKSDQAVRLLSTWRQSVDQFPFLAIAGPLHRRDGGVVGGLAPDWDHAVFLYQMACQRLDALASDSGVNFTSAWLLLLTHARIDRINALSAQLQATEGAA